jgi:prepilin signal peptidase PulO-like enzyme (type II secretory pathway)
MASFANALSYRLKEGKNFANDRSECPKCHKKLKWWELIPVFSFLFLRGKCSSCKESIGFHYLFIEIIGGLSFGTLSYFYINQEINILTLTLISVIFVGLLLIISSDMMYLEIPNLSHLIILPGSLGLIFLLNEPLILHFFSAIFASIFFFALFKYTGENKLGFGDVKLVFSLGLIFGFFQFLLLVIISSILGVSLGLVISKYKNKKIREVKVPLGAVMSFVAIIFIVINFFDVVQEFLLKYDSLQLLL